MPKAKKEERTLTRRQRRKILFSHDGPDKIEFEHRKIAKDRYSVSPRRRKDKQLFESLSQMQQEAYNLIQEGWQYSTLIPIPRMRFTDARGGEMPELSKAQKTVLKKYHAWRKHTFSKFPGPYYAVMGYMEAQSLRAIENSLRISNGKAPDFIAKGLTEYCTLHGLRDPRPLRPRVWSNMRGGS
jgi:hypothetical protein